MDKLDDIAGGASNDNNNNNSHESKDDIQYVSICCDNLDGAREILERDTTPRWSHLRHFFMENEVKERAKALLGFRQVPFYVVFDDSGVVVFSGCQLPDLDDLLRTTNDEPESQQQLHSCSTPLVTTKTTSGTSSPVDVLALDFDDLDF